MRVLLQATARTITVFMTDSSDHITGKTSLTLTITASKNGATFSSISPTVTELANGWYALSLTTSHTDTLGDLALHITATGADPADLLMQVVAYNFADSVRLGLTALPNATAGANTGLAVVGTQIPNATAGANGGLPTCDANAAVKVQAGTGTGQLDFTSGVVKANVTQYGGTNGTFTSGRPEVNTTHIAGSSVSTSSAQIGVNVVNAGGTAWNSGAITRSTLAAETGLQTVRSNTAQAGASTSVTLDASASATDNYYKYSLIYLTGGTGAGQFRLCTGYVGSTKVATVTPAWTTNPDSSSTFAVLPAGLVDVEAYGGVAGTFTSGRPEVNTTHIAGSSVSTSSAQIGVNVVNAGGTAWNSGAITTGTFATGAIDAAAMNVNGSEFTAIPWNAAWDAEVQSEVQDAIEANHLDHIIAVADPGGVVANNSFLAKLTSKSGTAAFSSYDNTTDSLEALRDNLALASGVVVSSIGSGVITRATLSADTGLQTIRSNTAQSGAGGSITLDASASNDNDAYNDCWVYTTGGTGAGQCRQINDYDGTTKVATITPNWATSPDNTTTFAILPFGRVDVSAFNGSTTGVSGVGLMGNDYLGGSFSVDVTKISGDNIAANNLEALLDGTGGVTLTATAISLTTPISANATQISGDSVAADNAESFFDGTGYAGTNNVIPTVTNVTTVNGLAANTITSSAVASGAFTRAAFAAETGLQSVRSNTAQAGASGTITLDASASSTDDYYNGLWVYVTGGTGVGQARLITDYVGSTKVATIAPNWVTNPDNTSTFALLATAGVDLELWRTSVPSALISGRVDANTQATASSLTFDLTGSVSGAVGSVTGNVGGNVVGSVGSVTGNVGGNVTGSIGSLATQAKADVNAEVVDALATDTYAEPGQGAPPATTTIVNKVGYLYKAFRNKKTQTSSQYSLYADDTTTIDQKSTVADDGTTTTIGEVASGP